MNRQLLLSIFPAVLLLCSISDLFAGSPKKGYYSAIDSLGIAETSEGELLSYQSSFFPLSFSERGRQSATAWRGMPPGYLDYEFQNVPLVNPLWGYWDNQLLPLEIIRHRNLEASTFRYGFVPMTVRNLSKPVSRIAYSEDTQFGLSYLDANLSEYYRKDSYFRLGGNNILWSGIASQYTKTQVNTYRAQFHHQISSRLSIDLWYWQLRHRFQISPFPVVEAIQSVHRVGQVLWFNLNYAPDSTSRLTLTPYAYKWGDQFYTQGFNEQRKVQMYSTGIRLKYEKFYSRGSVQASSNLVRHKITKAFHIEENGQMDGEFDLSATRDAGLFSLHFGGGYRVSQSVGNAPSLSFGVGMKGLFGWQNEFRVSQRPQNVPLAPLFWSDDSISRLRNPKMPLRTGIDWLLHVPVGSNTIFKIRPFYERFANTWEYAPDQARFRQDDIDNSGLFTSLETQIWRLHLKDEFTYSSNYQESFIPQTNNVLIANFPLSLFNNALKLDGYAIYHFIGLWRPPDYDPLTNQYVRTGIESGNFHLLDLKLLFHVRTATLFLVSENTISQDYALISGYTEFFRVIRFGIYWTLFN